MDQATFIALADINRRFYTEHAREFSATRQAPWRGWQRVLECLADVADTHAALRVLDLGCGNGRFLRFLGRWWHGPFAYAGVDLEIPFFGEGPPPRLPSGATADWHAHDFLAASVPLPTGIADRFDLIGLFGVLHHVPSFARRRALLSSLAERLGPRGILAATLWQFGDQERFRRRLVPWSESERTLGVRISESELEPGDCLLRWGTQASAVRYCHHVTLEEWARLTDGLGLRVVAGYSADGKTGDLNAYRLLRPADVAVPSSSHGAGAEALACSGVGR